MVILYAEYLCLNSTSGQGYFCPQTMDIPSKSSEPSTLPTQTVRFDLVQSSGWMLAGSMLSAVLCFFSLIVLWGAIATVSESMDALKSITPSQSDQIDGWRLQLDHAFATIGTQTHVAIWCAVIAFALTLLAKAFRTTWQRTVKVWSIMTFLLLGITLLSVLFVPARH